MKPGPPMILLRGKVGHCRLFQPRQRKRCRGCLFLRCNEQRTGKSCWWRYAVTAAQIASPPRSAMPVWRLGFLCCCSCLCGFTVNGSMDTFRTGVRAASLWCKGGIVGVEQRSRGPPASANATMNRPRNRSRTHEAPVYWIWNCRRDRGGTARHGAGFSCIRSG